VEGSAVVGVQDSPGFDVSVGAFDNPADLVDAGVACAVAFGERVADRLFAGSDGPGALVALVGDDGVGVEVFGDVVVVPGGLVVGRAGQGVGDPGDLAVGAGGDLVVVAGGVVLAGEQLGVVLVGPAGGEGAVEDEDQLLGQVLEGGDILSEGSLDRSL